MYDLPLLKITDGAKPYIFDIFKFLAIRVDRAGNKRM